jgi:hypothetical protein
LRGIGMVYNARTQRGVLGFLLAISVTSIKWISLSDGLLFVQILISVLFLMSIFIQYKFKIDDGFLTYEISFFGFPIYNKVIYPNQIIQIKFKRIGWATKAAIIHVNKGINIRVFNFSPKNVFIDLLDFANKNGISITKTKDYLILES